jgi:hypothetical protein
MNAIDRLSRGLGVAFLLQFVTSLASGAVLKPMWLVAGDMAATLVRIAERPLLMRGFILLDVATALGVAFLGAMLYLVLRRHDERIAMTAFAFYMIEAALLAASRGEAFALLRIAEAYEATGRPDALLSLGGLAYASMDFVGNTLHMLAFCLGALLFYGLLVRSGFVPRWLALWGLVATVPMLVGTIAQVFGSSIPFFFYLPYVPFEMVVGGWILIKGLWAEAA